METLILITLPLKWGWQRLFKEYNWKCIIKNNRVAVNHIALYTVLACDTFVFFCFNRKYLPEYLIVGFGPRLRPGGERPDEGLIGRPSWLGAVGRGEFAGE